MASEDYISDGSDPSLLRKDRDTPEKPPETKLSVSFIEEQVELLKASCGGMWGESPNFPLADWRYEVVNNDTRLGYWEWVFHQIDSTIPNF